MSETEKKPWYKRLFAPIIFIIGGIAFLFSCLKNKNLSKKIQSKKDEIAKQKELIEQGKQELIKLEKEAQEAEQNRKEKVEEYDAYIKQKKNEATEFEKKKAEIDENINDTDGHLNWVAAKYGGRAELTD